MYDIHFLQLYTCNIHVTIQLRFSYAIFGFVADGVPEKLGGAICMHYDEANGRGQFLWTHTTASMGLAYQTTSDATAKTVMSRINTPPMAKGTGVYILTESIHFTTKSHLNNKSQPCSLDSTQEPATTSSQIESAKA